MAKQYAVFEEWKADGSKPETALYIHKDELRKKEQDPRYTPAFYKLQTEEHYDLRKKLQEKRQEDEGKCHMNVAAKVAKLTSAQPATSALLP